jgi:SNF2 family DNA or RNA helicase
VQVIFYEQDWNPQADKQALQRAHRIGQKSPVLAINLITPNTIEEVSTVKGMMKLTSSKSLISECTPSTI